MQDFITQTGLLFYPLCAVSLVGLALIFERIIFFARLKSTSDCPNFVTLKAQLEANANLPKPVRDELISCLLLELKDRLEFGIRMLRIIAVLSPMLGLLGTVLGMIDAFQDISVHTGPVSPAMIADGLWSAMLTTAYGLIIALPCLFCAFIFARIAEKRIAFFQKELNRRSLEIEGVKFV